MNLSERKKLNRIQGLIGHAGALHGNDRDPNGFEQGQNAIKEAFKLCVEMLGKYPPVDMPEREP